MKTSLSTNGSYPYQKCIFAGVMMMLMAMIIIIKMEMKDHTHRFEIIHELRYCPPLELVPNLK